MSIRPLLERPELFLPDFMDEKEKLKTYLNKALETIINQNQHKREPYFIIFSEKSDGRNSRQKIKLLMNFPPFITNTIVWWVNNKSGLCEWLWTVPPREKGKKMTVEFNKSGVAYLQAKGAMPS